MPDRDTPPPPGEACTIVLRGATQQILDEAERSLHDALCVLAQTVKEPRTVYGGGSAEMLMAKVVSELANRTPGKEAVAMESFAKALRMVGCRFTRFSALSCEVLTSVASLQLPTIIADNAGYDSADLVAQLRAAHQENRTTFGLSEFGPPVDAGGQRRGSGPASAILNRCGCFSPLRHV